MFADILFTHRHPICILVYDWAIKMLLASMHVVAEQKETVTAVLTLITHSGFFTQLK